MFNFKLFKFAQDVRVDGEGSVCVDVLHTKLCCVCMLVVLANVSLPLYIYIECYVVDLCTFSVFKLPAG